MKNKILYIILCVCCTFTLIAQTGDNSPYSRFGIGDLSDDAFQHLKQMGSLGAKSWVAEAAPRTCVNVEAVGANPGAGASAASCGIAGEAGHAECCRRPCETYGTQRGVRLV